VAHLDNWNPETYLPLLEECDVPYVPEEWNSLLEKWGANPAKMTPTTIIGK
jgi:transposase